MQNKNNTSAAAEKTKTAQATWPDFAAGLYDKLSGKGSQITYEFENLDIFVPSKLGEADHFHWKLNGTIRMSTQDQEENND